MAQMTPMRRFNSAIEAAHRQIRNAEDGRFIRAHRARFIAVAKENVGLALGIANQMRDRVRRDFCLRSFGELQATAARAKRDI